MVAAPPASWTNGQTFCVLAHEPIQCVFDLAKSELQPQGNVALPPINTRTTIVVHKAAPTSIFWTDFGRTKVALGFSIPYIVVVLFLLGWALFQNPKLAMLEPWQRVCIVLGGIVLAAAPTAYWWRERVRFDKWLATTSLSVAQVDYEREAFKTNREFALALWTILLTTFLAIFIRT